jgi:Bacterial Ig-like domain
MRKILTIVTFVLSLILIVNIALHNIVVLKIPDASAQTSNIANFTFTPSILTKNITNTTANVLQQYLKTQQANLTTQQVKANATAQQVKANATAQQVKANATAQQVKANATTEQVKANAAAERAKVEQQTEQLQSFRAIITVSITGIGALIITPLLVSMYFTYRTGGTGTNIRPLVMSQVYRVLVAIGVIFTVLVILIYLNSMIWFNMSSPNITVLLETQKNFLTIIGTAFASLVAFYFGARSSQGSNAERTTAVTKPESAQKALEVMDVNPIDGSMGVEVESPVTASFSSPVRSSTINSNTFSVKDANGNPVQGKTTLTDNNTTIRFNPVSPFNRNSRYTVTITKGLMNISGASIAADKEWHFTTVA